MKNITSRRGSLLAAAALGVFSADPRARSMLEEAAASDPSAGIRALAREHLESTAV